MAWTEFGVLEVADICGLTIKEYSLGKQEIEARCPFCDDTKYHLNLNRIKNQWLCFKCGERGNDVSLYSRLHGISNAEAVKELKKRGLGTAQSRIITPLPKASLIKPLMDRHNVYFDMLSMLRLDVTHRNDLLNRGLSFANINQFMYKSVPRDPNVQRIIIRKLSERYDLKGIPGFYRSYGEWKMHTPKYGGFFVPVCNHEGYIQGMQIRYDTGDKRYGWFSTTNYPDGTGAQSWVHVVGNTLSQEAFLTEGALKCDVASSLSNGSLYIAVPGVNAIGLLPEALDNLNVKKIYEVFDMDKLTNGNVKKALIKVKSMLINRGIEVQSCTWNAEYKGIDDYYLFRRNFYEQQAVA